MSRPRQRSTGNWELCVRHPALPGGRRYYTYDTEADALAADARWRAMKQAGVMPPAEMLAPVRVDRRNLGMLLRAFESSGQVAPSQIKTLRLLESEVGLQRLTDLSHRWLMAYIQGLKARKRSLAPGSIRHRVQAIGQAIEHHRRNHPDDTIENPVATLPRGYASYSQMDAALASASGGKRREDTARDRRLTSAEEAAIVRSLGGELVPGRERPLTLEGGDALLSMFHVIVNTGLRLLEAVRLRTGWCDFERKVLRVQSSKQWRGAVRWREVPMMPVVYAALRNRIEREGLAGEDYVWPFVAQADGDVTLASRRLSARFLVAFEHAGVVGLHEHDLRHEATCRWLELRDQRGNWLLRDAEINRILGWAPGSTMALRYASFRAEDTAARVWEAIGAG